MSVALLWDILRKTQLPDGTWSVRGRPMIKRHMTNSFVTGSGPTLELAIKDMKDFYATANNYCSVTKEASDGMYSTPGEFLFFMFDGPPADFYNPNFN